MKPQRGPLPGSARYTVIQCNTGFQLCSYQSIETQLALTGQLDTGTNPAQPGKGKGRSFENPHKDPPPDPAERIREGRWDKKISNLEPKMATRLR